MSYTNFEHFGSKSIILCQLCLLVWSTIYLSIYSNPFSLPPSLSASLCSFFPPTTFLSPPPPPSLYALSTFTLSSTIYLLLLLFLPVSLHPSFSPCTHLSSIAYLSFYPLFSATIPPLSPSIPIFIYSLCIFSLYLSLSSSNFLFLSLPFSFFFSLSHYDVIIFLYCVTSLRNKDSSRVINIVRLYKYGNYSNITQYLHYILIYKPE